MTELKDEDISVVSIDEWRADNVKAKDGSCTLIGIEIEYYPEREKIQQLKQQILQAISEYPKLKEDSEKWNRLQTICLDSGLNVFQLYEKLVPLLVPSTTTSDYDIIRTYYDLVKSSKQGLESENQKLKEIVDRLRKRLTHLKTSPLQTCGAQSFKHQDSQIKRDIIIEELQEILGEDKK